MGSDCKSHSLFTVSSPAPHTGGLYVHMKMWKTVLSQAQAEHNNIHILAEQAPVMIVHTLHLSALHGTALHCTTQHCIKQ